MRPPCDCFCDRMTNDDDEIDGMAKAKYRKGMQFTYVQT